MISIARRQVRLLRTVFRKNHLGLGQRAATAARIEFQRGAGKLRAQYIGEDLAIEHIQEDVTGEPEHAAIPLACLADIEGTDETEVLIETGRPEHTTVSWMNGSIPISRTYSLIHDGAAREFPALTSAQASADPRLITALATASEVSSAPGRYAFDRLQLRGARGEIVATDGRRMLFEGGFRFPWNEDVLIPSSTLFGCRAFAGERAIEIGKRDTHVVIRIGDWTIWLKIDAGARFPQVDRIVEDLSGYRTHLFIDETDAGFLADALEHLPEESGEAGSVTLDLNGLVAIRSRGEESGRTTELMLSRSHYQGPEARICSFRSNLAEALRFGFREVRISKPEAPILGCGENRRYLWMPLNPETALPPSDDAMRIDSSSVPAATTSNNPSPSARMPRVRPQNNHHHEAIVPMTEKINPRASDAEAIGTPIQEAEALRSQIREALAHSTRLLLALRRQKKQSRLVKSTLASLRQLGLHEIAG